MEAGGPKRRNQSGYKYRRIVFTLNNWTPAEYAAVCSNDFKWMVVGKEVGEEGTPHLQGAAVLGKQYTLTGLKKLPGMARAHFQSMGGTCEQNLAYCSKQDTAAFTKGSMPKEGKAEQLKHCYEDLKAGATMRELALTHGVEVIKYYRGLTACRSLLAEARSEPPKVIWLFGPTGVGKTRCCTDFARLHMGGDYWMSTGALQWFDGYDGQQCAIIDDFRGKHCSFSFLLRLLDRYPLLVPIKGNHVNWRPSVIFITAPYGPDEIFAVRREHLPEDMAQLTRRISKVIHWKDDGVSQNTIMEILTGFIDLNSPAITFSTNEDGNLDVLGHTKQDNVVIDLCSDEEEVFREEKDVESDEISLESYLFNQEQKPRRKYLYELTYKK